MKIKHIKESRNFKISDPKYKIRTWDGGNDPNNEALPQSGETAIPTGAVTENQRQIIGYASVFNTPSKLLAEIDQTGEYVLFYEVIAPGAFDDILNSAALDCIYNIDHNPERLISRTKAGNLQLSVDDYGLKFVSTVPNTTEANDLYENISVGNLQENSFCFIVDPNDETWSAPDKDGIQTRTILKVNDLLDVSSVVNAAYPSTQLSLRGREELRLHGKKSKTIEATVLNNDLLDSEIFLLKYA